MAAVDVVRARVVAAAVAALAGVRAVLPYSDETRGLLRNSGLDLVARGTEASEADAVALLADELSRAGDDAEPLLAGLVGDLRPGTLVAASVRSVLHPGPGRGYRADELERALGHHGFDVQLVCAPGASGIVRGDPLAGYDPDLDRRAGLLDAGPRLLAVGRLAASRNARSAAFVDSLPRKVIAAAVLCLDADHRLLTVHDTFQDYWTIPGGVVDADEDPRSAAVREAWEEAGVVVEAGAVLGVFSAPWPDRLGLVYAAEVVAGADHRHAPVHAHEIDVVAWTPLERALSQLAPHIAEQVRCCLEEPGGTWRQDGG